MNDVVQINATTANSLKEIRSWSGEEGEKGGGGGGATVARGSHQWLSRCGSQQSSGLH